MSQSIAAGRLPLTGDFPALLRWLQMGWCAAILCAFASTGPLPYKAWFILAAMAAALTVFLVLVGAAHVRGLAAALLPVAAYFAYFFIAGTWSKYPGEAHRMSLVDATQILVFTAFYAFAASSKPKRVVTLMVSLALYSALFTIVTSNPEAIRSGGYALSVIPFGLPFIMRGLNRRSTRWRSIIALLSVTAILLIGRSRASILVAAIMAALTLLTSSVPLRRKIKVALIAALCAVGMVGILLAFRASRMLVLTTYARLAHHEMSVGDLYVTVDEDVVRDLLTEDFREMVMNNQPFGVGYQNFKFYFAERHQMEPQSLHSIYYVWALEGGMAGALIAGWMIGRHFLALRRAARRSHHREHRDLTTLIWIASIGVLVFGMFHQMHKSPVTFALLGMGAAMPYAPGARSRRSPGRPVHPSRDHPSSDSVDARRRRRAAARGAGRRPDAAWPPRSRRLRPLRRPRRRSG